MRNIKALSLALLAAFAVSAMAASAAHATPKPTFTSTVQNAATVSGHQLANAGAGKINAFTLDGNVFECSGGTFEVTGGVSTIGVHELDATPVYSGCKTTSGFFVTVTHNECEFTFFDLTTSTPHYSTRVELFCPGVKKQIEVHAYSDSNHTNLLCTYDVPQQIFKGALTVTNETTNPNGVIIEGTIEEITATRTTGAICGFGTHKHFTGATGGIYHAYVTVTGKNAGGEPVGLHVG